MKKGAAGGKKPAVKKGKAAKDPNKPKRPASAFFVFMYGFVHVDFSSTFLCEFVFLICYILNSQGGLQEDLQREAPEQQIGLRCE